jgi:hypothetical protein
MGLGGLGGEMGLRGEEFGEARFACGERGSMLLASVMKDEDSGRSYHGC